MLASPAAEGQALDEALGFEPLEGEAQASARSAPSPARRPTDPSSSSRARAPTLQRPVASPRGSGLVASGTRPRTSTLITASALDTPRSSGSGLRDARDHAGPRSLVRPITRSGVPALAATPRRESPLERPIVHARASTPRGPSDDVDAPPAPVPHPRPVPPHADPLPVAIRDTPFGGAEGDAAIFEHTVRGLTRTQLAALATRPPSLPAEAPRPMAGHVEAPGPLPGPRPELAPDPATTSTVTAFAPAPSRLFADASLVALTLLTVATLLPTASGAPWELLARPAEVTMQALAAFILIGVVHLLPATQRTRAIVGAGLGLVLAAFAIVAARVAISATAFDGQPAMVALFAGSAAWPAILAVAALILVPAALLGRALGTPTWHRVALGVAGLAAAAGTVALVPIDGFGSSLGEAPFLGDRVAAFATLPLLTLLVACPLALALHSLARVSGTLGFATWAAALLPLVVLALFSARSDQWTLVLEPLKLVAFIGAVALYTAAALAASFALGPPHRRRR